MIKVRLPIYDWLKTILLLSALVLLIWSLSYGVWSEWRAYRDRWRTLRIPVRFAVTGVALIAVAGTLFTMYYYHKRYKMPASVFIESGMKYLQERKLREAALEFRNAVQAEPGNAEAHLRLAQVLRMGRLPEDALKYYQATIRLNSRIIDAHVEMSQVALDMGNTDLALASARKAAELAPDSPMVHLLFAQIYRYTGKDAQAIAEYWKILIRDPTDLATWKSIVTIHLGKKEYVSAAQEAERGLLLNPKDPELRMMMVDALECLGRYEKAASILKEVAADVPTASMPLIYLAEQNRRTGDYAATISQLEEAVKRAPDDPIAMNNLAMALTDHGANLDGLA